MRLLFIIPYTPDPIRVRPYNLIWALAQRGHQITLATLWSNDKEHAYLEELCKEDIRVIAAPLSFTRSALNCCSHVLRPTPLQSVYSWQPSLMKQLRSALGTGQPQFDVVHVEHLRGARYGTHLRDEWQIADAEMQVPIIWDSVDCISHLFKQSAEQSRSPFGRLVTRLELPRTRWYEAWLIGRFNRVLVTSGLDRQAFCDLLQEFAPPANGHVKGINKICVVPNGVDLDYFSPTTAPRAPQTLVLTGKMSYHANVTAALYLVNEIMPLVWDKFPAAQVQIVGQNPPYVVRDLAHKYPGLVSVTGTVPDVRPYLARATLAVAPIIYGAGIQNKVLEAMAMKTPVVATPVAVSALAAKHETHFLLGNAPVSFAGHVIRLLRNPGIRERIGENGRTYVELNHSWKRIAEQLEVIYHEVIAESKRIA